MKIAFICPHGNPGDPVRPFIQEVDINSWTQYGRIIPGLDTFKGFVMTEKSLEQFKDYDLFILMLGGNTVDFYNKLRFAFGGKKILIWQDGSLDTFMQAYPKRIQGYMDGKYNIYDYENMLREADGILANIKNYMQFFELLNPKVFYFTIPFPESFLKYTKSIDKRKNIIYLSYRQDYVAYLAAKEVLRAMNLDKLYQFIVFDVGIPFTKQLEPQQEYGKSDDNVYRPYSDLKLMPCLPQYEYLEAIQHAKICLHLDDIGSPGRTMRECAALGIPCISTFMCDSWELYPNLAVPAYYSLNVIKEKIAWALCMWEGWSSDVNKKNNLQGRIHYASEQLIKTCGTEVTISRFNRILEEI